MMCSKLSNSDFVCMQETLVVTLLNARYEMDGLVHRITYEVRVLYDTPAESADSDSLIFPDSMYNRTDLGHVQSLSISQEGYADVLGMSHVALFIDQIYCLSSMISCPFFGWVRPSHPSPT
jgi:hypothetical protein